MGWGKHRKRKELLESRGLEGKDEDLTAGPEGRASFSASAILKAEADIASRRWGGVWSVNLVVAGPVPPYCIPADCLSIDFSPPCLKLLCRSVPSWLPGPVAGCFWLSLEEK